MCKEDDNRHSFYTFLKNRKNYEDNHPVVIFGCGRCEQFKDALYVLGSVFYNDAMTEQLMSLGINRENIFRYLHSVNIYGEQYFDEEIIKPYGSEGVFIDGGCLNLWETQRFIQKNPEYKLYIRHYSCYKWEMVLYAV